MDRIITRHDTKAKWEEVNPVLMEGETGYVTDNPNQYKIGDGINAWNDLPLRGYTGTISQETGDDENAVISQKVVTEKLTELSSDIGTISVYFDSEYQQIELPFTIKEGETIYLESEDGITELNCRTEGDLYSESPQLVTSGSIAEKDINYVRCLTILGSVNIYTDKSIKGRVLDLESKVESNVLNYEQFFVEGYRTTEVGAQLSDLKSEPSNSYYNALINVTQGEVYKIRGVGGITGRLWAKIKDGIVIETSNQSEENSETFFEITVDGSFDQLNFNSNKRYNPYLCRVSKDIDDEVIDLIDKSNKTLNQLNYLEYIKFREVLNFDIAYAHPTKINTTIPVGSVVYLESDDGIDSLNCRTTSEIDESPQLIKSGDIAEKDINYVRNLDKIGSVTILIENSYAGITHRIDSINKKEEATKNDFNLPSKVYVLKGVQSNFWHQSLVKTWNPYSYYLEFNGTADYQRRTPLVCSILTSSTENKTMEVTLWDNNNFKEISKKSAEVLVGEPNSSIKTDEIKVMFIGSSTVQLTYFDYAIKNYVNNYKLVGLRHKVGDSDCKHEGRGGASLSSYMTISKDSNRHYYPFWQPNGENRYWGATGFWRNAYLYPDSESGDGYYCGLYVQEALDKFNESTGILKSPVIGDIMYFNDESVFKRYNGTSWEVTENSSYTWGFDFIKYLTMWNLETPDIICITLGSNDFRYASLPIDFELWCSNMQKLIDSVHAVREDIQFVICNQGPFGNYGFDGENSYLMNYKMWLHLQSIISYFDNRQDENIYVLAQGAEISSEYGFYLSTNEIYTKPTAIYKGEEKMKIQSGDIVHPYLSLNNMGTPIASFIQYIRK